MKNNLLKILPQEDIIELIEEEILTTAWFENKLYSQCRERIWRKYNEDFGAILSDMPELSVSAPIEIEGKVDMYKLSDTQAIISYIAKIPSTVYIFISELGASVDFAEEYKGNITVKILSFLENGNIVRHDIDEHNFLNLHE